MRLGLSGMKLVAVICGGTLAGTSLAGTVWYNGDDDGLGGFAAVLGTPNGQGNWEGIQYEDFIWDSTSPAGTVMGTMVATSTFTQMRWEIRQGMSLGNNNAGTLVATGVLTPNLVDHGPWAWVQGMNLYAMTGSIGSVSLTSGNEYFLGLAILVPDAGFTGGFTTTDGTNGIGSPINNHNSFYIGSDGNLVDNFGQTGEADLSMGIGTAPVPEPASLAVLTLGAVALLRRRKAFIR